MAPREPLKKGDMVRFRIVLLLLVALTPIPGTVPRAGAQSDRPVEAVTETGPAAEAAAPAEKPDARAVVDTPPEDTSLTALDAAQEELAEYDPWVPFNETTFAFNHGLDQRIIKPVAKVYDKVVPDILQRGVKNIFENLGSFRRIVNTALQGRFNDSGQELGRFVINTFFGLGGLIDAAPSFGVTEKFQADTGQTFGVWGAGPGPYFVVPFFPPLTVRDAFGTVFDMALDPLTWVAPFEALLGVTGERTVNERSMNLELYESVEEGVFDLYSAVRNAYLQRRYTAVREGIMRGPFPRRERLILSGEE